MVLSQSGFRSVRNPVALKHVSVLVIVYSVEDKIESDFPNIASISLIDFSATT